jgi:hypothetical protein
VSEDERTVERPAEDETTADESGGRGKVDLDTTADLDRAAQRFLDLEGDLGGESGLASQGIVVDAERVDRSAAPADYPFGGDPTEVLALTVDTGDGEQTVYVGWPGANPEVEDWRRRDEADEGRLDWLLSAMGVGLGDLYGERVLLERVDGHLRVMTPTETPRSSGEWGLGVVAAQAVNAVLVGLFGLVTALGGGIPTALFGAWLGLTLLVVPYVTWKDGWYLRTHSDWDDGPAFWAALSALPGVNVLAGVEYLRRRAGATFFGDEPSLRTRLANRLRPLLR